MQLDSLQKQKDRTDHLLKQRTQQANSAEYTIQQLTEQKQDLSTQLDM